MRPTSIFAILSAFSLAIAGLALPVSGDGEAGYTQTSELVESFDGTLIDINICQPAGASASSPVPVVFHSHGWGGNKKGCDGFSGYLDAGIGAVSMTQRGNTGSEGQNNVMDPDLEGRDIVAVIDRIAELEWVAKDDGPGGSDPVMGGIGGSYGGGFQWVGAFTDQSLNGETRFNALTPGNTWYDLRESLAPNGVLRTEIVSGLYASGVASNNLAPWIHLGFATVTATGSTIDGPPPADFWEEIHQHGPAWFAEQGTQLDIPVRINQGAADIVFNMNDGWHSFSQALTTAARAQSLYIGHQGGHGLPGQIPQGEPLAYRTGSGQPCTQDDSFAGARAFLKHHLLGTPLPTATHGVLLGSAQNTCVALTDLPENQVVDVPALDGQALTVGLHGELRMMPLVEGPVTLAGIPTLTATVTTPHPDARLFWGLAAGTSRDNAELIDKQWMPSLIQGPALAEPMEIELGGIVDEIGEDEELYLAISPWAAQFVGHASRVPGAVVIGDVEVGLPIVE